jgi:hypothetical protein
MYGDFIMAANTPFLCKVFLVELLPLELHKLNFIQSLGLAFVHKKSTLTKNTNKSTPNKPQATEPWRQQRSIIASSSDTSQLTGGKSLGHVQGSH